MIRIQHHNTERLSHHLAEHLASFTSTLSRRWAMGFLAANFLKKKKKKKKNNSCLETTVRPFQNKSFFPSLSLPGSSMTCGENSNRQQECLLFVAVCCCLLLFVAVSCCFLLFLVAFYSFALTCCSCALLILAMP